MIIKYTNFSDGVHQFKLAESAKKMGLEEKFFGDVELNCRMDKSIHQIILDCNLTVHSKFECDRCGSETEKDFVSDFKLCYMFGKTSEKVDDFNFKIITPENDKIILDDDVYEYAKLSMPMKNLCSEDCKGLCARCGKNLNLGTCSCSTKVENDIWEPLQKLKEKFNN